MITQSSHLPLVGTEVFDKTEYLQLAHSTVGAGCAPTVRNPRASVLSVSPSAEDHAYLQRICEVACWKPYRANTCAEALRAIAEQHLDVIVCEADLPDGNWKNVLEQTSREKHTCYLIVTSRLADDYMWAEVLNLGGYDVLMKPFDAEEVLRVVGFACERCRQQRVVPPALGMAAAPKLREFF